MSMDFGQGRPNLESMLQNKETIVYLHLVTQD